MAHFGECCLERVASWSDVKPPSHTLWYDSLFHSQLCMHVQNIWPSKNKICETRYSCIQCTSGWFLYAQLIGLWLRGTQWTELPLGNLMITHRALYELQRVTPTQLGPGVIVP